MSKGKDRKVTPLTSSLSKINLCRYFLLPLVEHSLNERYIEDVLLDIEHPVLWVVLKVGIKGSQFVNGKHYISLIIPVRFGNDITLFRQGAYTKMSHTAKSLIIEKSGLIFNEKDSMNQAVSDAKLLGLIGHDTLRQVLNEELFDHVRKGEGLQEELLPSPRPEWFFDPSSLASG